MRKKEVNYEKDLSAQKETEKQGSRLQEENEDHRGQKNLEEKKKQGQKKAFRLISDGELFKNQKERGFSKTVQQGEKGVFPRYYVNILSRQSYAYGCRGLEKARKSRQKKQNKKTVEGCLFGNLYRAFPPVFGDTRAEGQRGLFL